MNDNYVKIKLMHKIMLNTRGNPIYAYKILLNGEKFIDNETLMELCRRKYIDGKVVSDKYVKLSGDVPKVYIEKEETKNIQLENKENILKYILDNLGADNIKTDTNSLEDKELAKLKYADMCKHKSLKRNRIYIVGKVLSHAKIVGYIIVVKGNELAITREYACEIANAGFISNATINNQGNKQNIICDDTSDILISYELHENFRLNASIAEINYNEIVNRYTDNKAIAYYNKTKILSKRDSLLYLVKVYKSNRVIVGYGFLKYGENISLDKNKGIELAKAGKICNAKYGTHPSMGDRVICTDGNILLIDIEIQSNEFNTFVWDADSLVLDKEKYDIEKEKMEYYNDIKEKSLYTNRIYLVKILCINNKLVGYGMVFNGKDYSLDAQYAYNLTKLWLISNAYTRRVKNRSPRLDCIDNNKKLLKQEITDIRELLTDVSEFNIYNILNKSVTNESVNYYEDKRINQ